MATTYYIRTVEHGGSDSNAGTGSASPWLTLNKAFTTISPGDTVYIGGGLYSGSSGGTATAAWATASTAQINIIGDYNGQYTGDAGIPVLTVIRDYNTLSASYAASNVVNMSGRGNIWFQNLWMESGNTATWRNEVSGSTADNITCSNCYFYCHGQGVLSVTMRSGSFRNYLWDKCVIITEDSNYAAAIGVSGLWSDLAPGYNVNFNWTNCYIVGGRGISVGNAGTSAVGFAIRDCTIHAGNGNGITFTSTSSFQTGSPCYVEGCEFIGPNAAMNFGITGSCTENYNIIRGSSARTNVNAGTGSVICAGNGFVYALPDRGQHKLFSYPVTSTHFDGLTDQSPVIALLPITWSNVATTDIYGRPRLTSCWHKTGSVGFTPGCFSLPNDGLQSDGGLSGSCLLMYGPGWKEFNIPLEASSSTISIWAKYDTTYSGSTRFTSTGKPQIVLLADWLNGVATQTVAMTSSANNWEKVSLATFTPSASSWVTVRLESYDEGGSGSIFWDEWEVT